LLDADQYEKGSIITKAGDGKLQGFLSGTASLISIKPVL
jgi:hypothetical protein